MRDLIEFIKNMPEFRCAYCVERLIRAVGQAERRMTAVFALTRGEKSDMIQEDSS